MKVRELPLLPGQEYVMPNLDFHQQVSRALWEKVLPKSVNESVLEEHERLYGKIGQ